MLELIRTCPGLIVGSYVLGLVSMYVVDSVSSSHGGMYVHYLIAPLSKLTYSIMTLM